MGNKIKLTESQLKRVIIETYKKVVLEGGRDDAYKTQIEKDFPDALNNYDGKTPYDQYYLQLSNNKKEQDKLNKRELSKQATRDRNEKYKAEFGERDKELKKQNIENKRLELIDTFVDFLPEDLPQTIEKLMKQYEDGKDSIFYFLIGKQIEDFGYHYNVEDTKKISDLVDKLITNEKYEDYFLDKISDKYGEGVIEW